MKKIKEVINYLSIVIDYLKKTLNASEPSITFYNGEKAVSMVIDLNRSKDEYIEIDLLIPTIGLIKFNYLVIKQNGKREEYNSVIEIYQSNSYVAQYVLETLNKGCEEINEK